MVCRAPRFGSTGDSGPPWEGTVVFIVSAQADTSGSLPSNTGVQRYLVITTPGSGAVMGDLLYDNGTGSGTMQIVPKDDGRLILPTVDMTGGLVEFAADNLYTWDDPDNTWVAAGAAYGLVTRLYIDIATTVPVSQQMGSVARPFSGVQDAIDRCVAIQAALGVSQFVLDFDVGDYSAETVNVPSGLRLLFDGYLPESVILGPINWLVTGAGTCSLGFRNVTVGAITIDDDGSPATEAQLTAELCQLSTVTSSPGSESYITLNTSGIAPLTTVPPPTNLMIVTGDIAIEGTITGRLCRFEGAVIATATSQVTECYFQGDLSFHGETPEVSVVAFPVTSGLLTINGSDLTGVNGAAGPNEFSQDDTNEDTVASNIAAAINDPGNPWQPAGVSAIAVGPVVTITGADSVSASSGGGELSGPTATYVSLADCVWGGSPSITFIGAAGTVFLGTGRAPFLRIGGTVTNGTIDAPNELQVGPSALADFTTIDEAVAYVDTQNPSFANPWTIRPEDGAHFISNPLTLREGVNLIAVAEAFIIATDPTEDAFILDGGASAERLAVYGVAGVGKAGFRCSGPGQRFIVDCGAFSCWYGVLADLTAEVYLISTFVTQVVSPFDYNEASVFADGIGTTLGVAAFQIRIPDAFIGPSGANIVQNGILVTGGAESQVQLIQFFFPSFDSTQKGINVDGGSRLNVSTCEIRDCTLGTAVYVGATAGVSEISISAGFLVDNGTNFAIDSATGRIFVNAVVDDVKSALVPGAVLTGVLPSETDEATLLTNDVRYRYPSERQTSLAEALTTLISSGIATGGDATDPGGLALDVDTGTGWVRRGTDTEMVEWTAATGLALTANSTNYVFYNGNSEALDVSLAAPGGESISLWIAVTNGTDIIFLHDVRYSSQEPLSQINTFLLATQRTTFNTGLSVSAGSVPATRFEVASGSYFVAMLQESYAGSGGDAAFVQWYGNGASSLASTSDIQVTSYDNAGVLTAMTAAWYRADTVYITSDGRISIVIGTDEYATQAEAEAEAPGSVFPAIVPTAFAIAQLIVQKTTGIVNILDIRTSTGSGTSAATGNHSLLSNLNADDHTQYLLVSGARAMGGSLNMGANNITNLGTANGVTIEAHAVRHQEGGADAVPNATTLVGGLMSAADKTLFDAIAPIGALLGDGTPYRASGVWTLLSVSSVAAANALVQATGTGKIDTSYIPDLSGTYQVISAKGANNGYAPLGSTARLPTANTNIGLMFGIMQGIYPFSN